MRPGFGVSNALVKWLSPLLFSAISFNALSESVSVDFESGDLSQANFSLQGDGQWQINSNDDSSNLYNLQSPALGAGQNASLVLSEVFTSSFVYYTLSVSTEVGDKVEVLIDGEVVKTHSGIAQINDNLYLSSTGQHEIAWRFSKDLTFDGGEDKAWIESINFSRADNVDTDGDGVIDFLDNCVDVANPSQLNSDGDSRGGDACDTDDDNDGILDVDDEYPTDPLRTGDFDGDGIDNLVDTDDDNDGVSDEQDAFPLDASEQLDTDGDLLGNNTDTDDDNDGMPDAWELSYGFDSLDKSDRRLDADGDGFSNDWEYYFNTNPHVVDQNVGDEGKLQWQYQIQDESRNFTSHTIGADGSIYLAGDSLTKLSKDGELLWRRDFGRSLVHRPVISNSGQIYVATSYWLYALSADGMVLWYHSISGSAGRFSVNLNDNLVYLAYGVVNVLDRQGEVVTSFDAPEHADNLLGIDSANRYYFSAYDNNYYTEQLYSAIEVTTSTGEQVWQYQIPKNYGYAIDYFALSDDGTIYFSTLNLANPNNYSSYLLAVKGNNGAGELLWQHSFGDRLSSGFGDYGPTIGRDGIVYVNGRDFNYYAFKPDGSILFTVPTLSTSNSSATLADNGDFYFTNIDQTLVAVDSLGQVKWRLNDAAIADQYVMLNHQGQITSIAPDNTFKVLSSKNGGLMASSWPVVGYDLSGGWSADVDTDGDGMPDSYESANQLPINDASHANEDTDGDGISDLTEFVSGSNPTDATSVPSLSHLFEWATYSNSKFTGDVRIAANGDIITAHDWSYSRFTALGDTVSNNSQWGKISSNTAVSTDFKGQTYLGLKDGIAAYDDLNNLLWLWQSEDDDESFNGHGVAVDSDSRIYAHSESGRLYVLDDNGQLVWSKDIDAQTRGVIAADGSSYYITTDELSLLVAVDKNGQDLWSKDLGEAITTSITLDDDGSLYFATDSGKIYALNADGSERWVVETEVKIEAEGVIGNEGNLYYVTRLGELIAINDGAILWRFAGANLAKGAAAVDANGVIYFATGDKLYRVDSQGNLIGHVIDLFSDVTSDLLITAKGKLLIHFESYLLSFDTQSNGFGQSSWPMTGANTVGTYSLGADTTDTDGDGVIDKFDNCPLVANTKQLDFDNDLLGDACDDDDDNDGVPDSEDDLPFDGFDSVDTDSDGIGDNEDKDDDNDGLGDSWEIANGLNPLVYQDPLSDSDNDGLTLRQEYLNNLSASEAYTGNKAGLIKWQIEQLEDTHGPLVLDSNNQIYLVKGEQNQQVSLYAYDQHGLQSWKVELGGVYEYGPMINAANEVVVATGNDDGSYIHVFDVNGKQLWRKKMNRGQVTALASNQLGQIIGISYGKLFALDSLGNELFYLADSSVGNSQLVVGPNNYIYAVDLYGDLEVFSPDGTRHYYRNLGNSIFYQISFNALGEFVTRGHLGVQVYDLNYKLKLSHNFDNSYENRSPMMIDALGGIYVRNQDNNGDFRIDRLSPGGGLLSSIDNAGFGANIAIDNAGGIVYFDRDSSLVVADSHGQLKWQYQVGSPPKGDIRLDSQGDVVFATQSGVAMGLFNDASGPSPQGWPMAGANAGFSRYISAVNDDIDGDGILNDNDNCPYVVNPLQTNTDGANDGGDACDSDDDNDGVTDLVDLLPLDKHEQSDNDGDGIGDNRDNDDDNDGVRDEDDAFPLEASEWLDSDNDGIGNNADLDDDNDGLSDSWELAHGFDPLVAGEASQDSDGDGFTNEQEYVAGTDPNSSSSNLNSIGARRWLTTLEGASMNSYVRRAIAIGAENLLYFVDDSGYVIAIEPNAKLKFRRIVSRAVNSASNNVAIDNQGSLYMGDTWGEYYQVAKTGEVIWEIEGSESFNGQATALGADSNPVAVSEKRIISFNSDGSTLWEYEATTNFIGIVLIDGSGLVYAPNSDGNIYVVDGGNLVRQLSLNTLDDVSVSTSLEMVLGPDGSLIFHSNSKTLYAFDSNSEQLWQFEHQHNLRSGLVSGVNQELYVVDEQGQLLNISSQGQLTWLSNAVESDSYSNSKWHTPLVGDDGVIYYVKDFKHLYAIYPDGRVAWDYQYESVFNSQLTMDDAGTLYVIGESSVWREPSIAMGFNTTSSGVATSAWPMQGANTKKQYALPAGLAGNDWDGDGVNNDADNCPLVANSTQLNSDDADDGGDACDIDDDNDQLPDYWEILYGLDATNASDAALDSDNDGASNISEYQSQTNPNDSQSLSYSHWGSELSRVVIDREVAHRMVTSPDGSGRYAVGNDGYFLSFDQNGQIITHLDFTATSYEVSDAVTGLDNNGNTQIYVSGIHNNETNYLYALSNQGNLLWERSYSGRFQYVSVADNGDVYVNVNRDAIVVLDSNGNEKWRKEYDSWGLLHLSVYHSPSGQHIAGLTNGFVAFDDRGNQLWSHSTYSYPDTLSIDDDGSLYYSYNGSIYKLSSQGKKLWQASISQGWNHSILIDKQHRVYVLSDDKIYQFHTNGLLLNERNVGNSVKEIALSDEQQLLLLHTDNKLEALDEDLNSVYMVELSLTAELEKINLLSEGKLFAVDSINDGAYLVSFDVDKAQLQDSPWPIAYQNLQASYGVKPILVNDDVDGDGIANDADNCPWFYNPSQLDFDQDGAVNGGDACDVDDDNDGVNDLLDAFPFDESEWLDTDKDNIGNNADWDDDNDGVADEDDAFALDYSEWLDTDLDGIGNNQDLDDDNDGMPDSFELANGLDFLLDDANLDADGDGATNLEEMLAKTNPNDASEYPGTIGTVAWGYDVAFEAGPFGWALSQSRQLHYTVSTGWNDYSRVSVTDGSLNWTNDDVGSLVQSIDVYGNSYTLNTLGHLMAISADGSTLWQTNEVFEYELSALITGIWYVSKDRELRAYDTVDGQLLWQKSLDNEPQSMVVDSRSGLYVLSANSSEQLAYLTAYDLQGEQLWQYSTESSGYKLSPVVLDSMGDIYFYDGKDSLLKLSFDGSLLKKLELQPGDYGQNHVSEIYIDQLDRLYLRGGYSGANITALNKDYSIRWQYSYYANRRFESMVIGQDNMVNILLEGSNYDDGDILVILDEYGREYWSKIIEKHFLRQPILLDEQGYLYVSSERRVDVYHTGLAGIGKGGWPSSKQNMQMTNAILSLSVSGDRDGDGINDFADNCPWVANTEQLNTDGLDDGGDACDADDDNDNLPDYWELQYGFSTTDSTDGLADFDNDGYSNYQEYTFGTNPAEADVYIDSIHGKTQWYNSQLNVQYKGDSGIDNEGNLYISCVSDKICVLDSQGQLSWEYQFEQTLYSNSVIDDEGMLLAVAGQTLYRIDQDGQLLWHFDTNLVIESNRPVVSADGVIYLLSKTGVLLGFNLQGEKLWQIELGGTTFFEPVVLESGDVALVSAKTASHHLWFYHIDASGQIVTERQLGISGVISVPLSLSVDDHLYIGTDTPELIKIDIHGELVWKKSLQYQLMHNIVIDAHANSYLTNQHNQIIKFNADGDKAFLIVNDAPISALVLGKFSSNQQVLFYMDSDKGLYALNQDGLRMWHANIYNQSPYHDKLMLSADGHLRFARDYGTVLSIEVNATELADGSWGSYGGNRLSQGRVNYGMLDSDNDGVADILDNCVNDYNPDQLNTDGANDGGNVCDADDDNDGVNDEDDAFPLDASETVDTDGDGIGNNRDTDDDGDGMSDSWEIANGLDSLDATDASLDSDGDGFTNLEEYYAGTNPNDADSIPEYLGLGALGVIIQLLQEEDKSKQQVDELMHDKEGDKEPMPPVH